MFEKFKYSYNKTRNFQKNQEDKGQLCEHDLCTKGRVKQVNKLIIEEEEHLTLYKDKV